jgi:hypothetical protein
MSGVVLKTSVMHRVEDERAMLTKIVNAGRFRLRMLTEQI